MIVPVRSFTRTLTVPALLAAVIALFCVSPTPALAAAPEPPELTIAQPVASTSATFLGVLQPAATEPAEPGEYRFLYKQGSECSGASETLPGLSFGGVHEELPGEPVSGLSADTEYTVCLSLTTPGGTTPSPPVHFTTALPRKPRPRRPPPPRSRPRQRPSKAPSTRPPRVTPAPMNSSTGSLRVNAVKRASLRRARQRAPRKSRSQRKPRA